MTFYTQTAHGSNSIICQPRRPVSFRLERTRLCALACTSIYVHKSEKKYKNEMDHYYAIHLQQLFSLRQFKIAAQRICVLCNIVRVIV